MSTPSIPGVHSIRTQNRKGLQGLWKIEVMQECAALAHILEAEENGRISGEMEDGQESQTGGGLTDTLQEQSCIMAENGVPPSETARAIFSLRSSLLAIFQRNMSAASAINAMIPLNQLIDRLGLLLLETCEENRETLLHDQQLAGEEVAVPVAKVWDKILMMPLLGMLDGKRTQLMMEALLSAIEANQSRVAILDITGIPITDSIAAKHLVMIALATRLMGAECVIAGGNSTISETVIAFGGDLAGIRMRSSLADGLKLAFSLIETRATEPEFPLFVFGDNIIVPIQIELDDAAALKLRDDILLKIERTGSSGLIIDISAVPLIDTFLGRLLVEIACKAKAMGCETVIAGMKKEVVISIVYLGLDLTSLNTALNLEHGLQMLKSLGTGGAI